MLGPIVGHDSLSVTGGILTDELYVGQDRNTTRIKVDQSGLLTVNKDLLLPPGSVAYFADPLGIIINGCYLSVRYFRSIPALYFNGIPINSFPQDFIGSSIDISAGNFYVYPTGKTHIGADLDVSGNLLVRGRSTFLDASGIFFTGNNYLNVRNGTLLVNGATISSGSSGAYPSDISGTSLNISKTFTVDSSGNTDISGTLVVHNPAIFLDPGGIYLANDRVSIRYGVLQVNGVPVSSGGSGTYPSDISGTSLNISNTFKVISSGNTDISGTLTVYGRATFTDSSGIYFSNNNRLVVNSTGTLLVNGAPISGGSGSYPQDITASSLNMSSGKFIVTNTGKTSITSSLDVSGISYLNGGTDITGRFNVYQGSTRVLYYDYGQNETIINNLAINPSGSFQAGSSGANSLIQILAGGSTVSLVNAQSANTICYPNTNNGVALAVKNTGITGAVNSTNPLITIGDMASLNDSAKLLTNDLVLKGNMYVEGNIQYTGTLTGQAGTGGLGWSDISAAIASQFTGAGATGYLNVTNGVTGITGITNPVSATYGGFTGNYVPNTASTAEIIRTLNMIISNQNRIIAALLNKPTSGP